MLNRNLFEFHLIKEKVYLLLMDFEVGFIRSGWVERRTNAQVVTRETMEEVWVSLASVCVAGGQDQR